MVSSQLMLSKGIEGALGGLLRGRTSLAEVVTGDPPERIDGRRIQPRGRLGRQRQRMAAATAASAVLRSAASAASAARSPSLGSGGGSSGAEGSAAKAAASAPSHRCGKPWSRLSLRYAAIECRGGTPHSVTADSEFTSGAMASRGRLASPFTAEAALACRRCRHWARAAQQGTPGRRRRAARSIAAAC